MIRVQGQTCTPGLPLDRRIPGRSCWGVGGEQLLLVVHFVPVSEQEAGSASLCCAQDWMKAACLQDPSSNAAYTLLLQIRNTVQILTLFCSAEKAAFSLENMIKMGSGLISTHEVGLVTQANRAIAL